METLKKIRKQNNLKQSDVAKYLGIAVSSYSMYESGKRKLDINQLKKLVEFYDVSADYILGIIDDPYSPRQIYYSKKYNDQLKELQNQFEKNLKLQQEMESLFSDEPHVINAIKARTQEDVKRITLSKQEKDMIGENRIYMLIVENETKDLPYIKAYSWKEFLEKLKDFEENFIIDKNDNDK